MKGSTANETGITYIDRESDKFVSYGELYSKALKVLYNLQSKGLKPGQELVFQLEDNESFVNIFWACMLGGIIPVPVPIGIAEEHRLRLFKIFNILREPWLITSGRIYGKIEEYMQDRGLQELRRKLDKRTVLAEEIYEKDGVGSLYNSQPGDTAFIQFSSGSTGEPKGVILTHENLLVNMRAIDAGAGLTGNDSCIGWMPLTHDMGLIAFHLTPVFAGINQYIMPTMLFMTDPLKWLDKADQYRISILASPNFGYKHFLGFLSQAGNKAWELSCIRLFINGAEPISAGLSNEFFSAMSRFGLKKETAFQVYGMAEACVAVTFSPLGEGLVPVPVHRDKLAMGQPVEVLADMEDTAALIFVDLGFAVEGCSVRICDDDDRTLGAGLIGNIQIKGGNVTSGYYNDAEATARTFTGDGWLRTGDLGFMKEGSLVVTGRKKDIIFVNGQNYYPHDIERVVEEVEGLGMGQVSACGLYSREKQTEEIGLFVFYKGDMDKFAELAMTVKKYVNKKTGLEVGVVIPVEQMPRTTSGKIQRYRLKELYDAGAYDEVLAALAAALKSRAEARTIELPRDEVEESIYGIWSKVLGSTHIGINDSFFELGGDSLKAAYIVNGIFREFGVEIPLKDIFEEPTISRLAEYIRNADKTVFEPIEKVPEQEYYEVSSAQKRLFALSRINSSDTSYNISQAVRINGKLEKERLERACRKLVARHESLRTCFAIVDGVPVQKVLEKVDVNIEYFKAPESAIESKLSEFVGPFDLEKAPLFKMGLIELETEKHIFVLDIHHIIADGTSVGILLDELIGIYEGGEPGEPQIQYKDYAAWQNKKSKDAAMAAGEQYWLKEFAGEVPVLELPADHARPAFKSFQGDKLYFELDTETSSTISRYARENNISIFMLLLSAYYILLKKYTNQEDIVVGTSIAGRSHPHLDDMVGMLVNTLPLRNYPQGEKTFADFVGEVKKNTLGAYENQSYQFDTLVEKLGVERDMSRNPLFDTMFVMQNMKAVVKKSGELDIEIFPVNNRTAKFDLTFFAWEINDRLCVEVEYCTQLFKSGTIAGMWMHYCNILKEAMRAPQQRLADINMLSREEMTKLIYEYNKTGADAADDTIVMIFEKRVKKDPDNIAIFCGDRRLTYRELNERANALARLLRSKGMGRNDIAAIVADRSIELVIAILAVLKSGGAYVPIDPGYPAERIGYMLEDSKAKLLLTQEDYISRFAYKGEIIDICSEAVYEGEVSDPEHINSPEDLAYVIYTSGSTGKPKGVMLEHRNLANYITWAAKSYLKGELLNFPLYTTISFDLTVTSVFTPLVAGSSIVVFNDDAGDVLIRNVVGDRRIGVVKATPAHLKLIMNDDNRDSSVRRFIVGGEQLDTELSYKLQESFGGQLEIYNEYGPTEATVGCMIHKYDIEADRGASVPIGVPAENAQIYLLDKDMNPVPEKVPGEMYISGRGIARGYLGREELTAERFLDNPFIKGGRMYKTGDMARLLPGGKMEYIGRIDQQVKIRGYRIELGEIENRLLKHESVEQAVVVDRNSGGEKYLAAYLVARTDIPAVELREHLLKELPEYMVPSYFVRLDSIPLTVNGKVNKGALPEPREYISADSDYEAPSNELEEMFAEIWAEVLGVKRVGVCDNYFSLGGDSIKAIQIASRLGQRGIDIKVKDILVNQTIRLCCLNCSTGGSSNAYDQGIIGGNIGLTPISRWFLESEHQNPNYYNQSVVLSFKEQVDIDRLRKVLFKLLEQHDGLRLNLDPAKGGLYFNNSHLEKEPEIEVFDISAMKEEEQRAEIAGIGRRVKSGFDIESSLLIKCAVINAGGGGQYVLLTAHHLVVDGVSWRIILEDMYSYYRALESVSDVVRSKKTASINDWYHRLTSYLANREVSCSAECWKDIGSTDFELPLDNAIGAADWSSRNKKTAVFELDEAYTCKLIKESHKAYNTDTQDLLLTALAGTLKDWSGRSEIVVELESHGRQLEDIDLSRTVGWFTSIYPIKLEIVRDEPGEQIKAVKEQLRSIPKGGIDYGVLKYLSGELSGEALHRPYVRFNYLGQFDSEVQNDLFSYAEVDTGEDADVNNSMTAMMEINCMSAGGTLKFELSYNGRALREETMDRFAQNYINNLKRVIDHVLGMEDIVFTPSDFDTVKLGQEELDMLFE